MSGTPRRKDVEKKIRRMLREKSEPWFHPSLQLVSLFSAKHKRPITFTSQQPLEDSNQLQLERWILQNEPLMWRFNFFFFF